MNLSEKKVTTKLAEYNEIKELIKNNFPKDERMSIDLLMFITMFKGIDFTAYYDKDVFIGITYTVKTRYTLYVLYLAISRNLQSSGYGSHILDMLKDKSKEINKPITLFIESVMNKSVDNYNQRIKRLSFYEKNGFINNNIKAIYDNIEYNIISTDKDLDVKKAQKVLAFTGAKIEEF